MTNRTITIAEIAAAAGVSIPTVSKVLNGRKGVAPDTRREVERLLNERGYQRRPRTGRGTGLVDFVIRSLETQWAAALLRGAESEAARLGVGLVVTTTHGRAVGTPDWLDDLVERGSDGVVLVVSRLLPAARDELARVKMPVVLVDPVGTGDQGFATVAATDWAGARDATEHLLALGHRRIGMVTGPIDEGCHQDRLDGYRTALHRAGVPYDERLVRFGDSLVGGGLGARPRPAAFRRAADGDHQRLGRAGLRHLQGGARGRPAHPRRPVRGRLRRRRAVRVGVAAAHHGATAADRDGA